MLRFKGGEVIYMQKGNIKIIIFIVILGLAGLGYFIYQGRSSRISSDIDQNDLMSGEKPMVEDVADSMEMESFMTMVTSDPSTLTGNLGDVSGGQGSGVGYVLRGDGKLYHYLEADLPDPEIGTLYEGWLVKKSPELVFFSTGVLKKTGDTYGLSYSAEEEYPGYDFVVVTLETVIDDTPEDHIIEGTVE